MILTPPPLRGTSPIWGGVRLQPLSPIKEIRVIFYIIAKIFSSTDEIYFVRRRKKVSPQWYKNTSAVKLWVVRRARRVGLFERQFLDEAAAGVDVLVVLIHITLEETGLFARTAHHVADDELQDIAVRPKGYISLFLFFEINIFQYLNIWIIGSISLDKCFILKFSFTAD